MPLRLVAQRSPDSRFVRSLAGVPKQRSASHEPGRPRARSVAPKAVNSSRDLLGNTWRSLRESGKKRVPRDTARDVRVQQSRTHKPGTSRALPSVHGPTQSQVHLEEHGAVRSALHPVNVRGTSGQPSMRRPCATRRGAYAENTGQLTLQTLRQSKRLTEGVHPRVHFPGAGSPTNQRSSDGAHQGTEARTAGRTMAGCSAERP